MARFPSRRGSKYHNHIVEVDGLRFQSHKEAKRYQELKLMQRAGEIKNLKTQVTYTFPIKYPSGHGIRYRADFTYDDVKRDITVTEDVKGMQTDVFRIKQAMMKHFFGIKILVT